MPLGKRNSEVFFGLLKAGLWEKTVLVSEINATDFEALYYDASNQAVTGIVAAGLEMVAQKEILQGSALLFAGEVLQLEQRNKAMNGFLTALINKLNQNDVYTLLVKGQGIAHCYEKPLWRSCGDIDLFLSDENYEKAKALLMPLATKVEKEARFKKHLGLTIDGWLVELHGSLRSGLSNRVDRELDGIKNDTFFGGNVKSWNNNGVQIFMLAPENNAAYVFSHILDHFYKGGIGLRQICDWCRLLWYYRSELDLAVLKSRIRRMGVMTEWKAFGAFAVDWLGMPADAMPLYSSDVRWSKKAERIKDFVMEVGNFGHNRDMSYYNNKPFAIRKVISLKQRISDLLRHARIFPLDSFSFFWGITSNGVRAMIKN